MSDALDDAELLKQFEDCSLPYESWTHRAHVRVAYLYLKRHAFDEALPLVREGIQRFNQSKNVPEGPLEGYNETTTQAFLHLIAATLNAYENRFPTSASNDFCEMHPQLMTPQVLRLFYSPERRSDPEGKIEFVPPDLTALPRLGMQ